ncbi:MAG: oligosaccharide flippase family protein [Planctomycetota bacterium]
MTTLDSQTRPPPSKSLSSRMASGTLWNLAGTIFSRMFTVVATVASARILGRELFGGLGAIQSSIRQFSPIAGRGLGGSATKYVSDLRNSDPVRAGRILFITVAFGVIASVVTSGIVFVLAGNLARMINSPHLVWQMQLGAIWLMTLSLSGLASDILAGFHAFRSMAMITILEGIAMLAAMVVLTWYFSLTGAMVSLAISTGVSLAYGIYAIRRECARSGVRVEYRGAWSEIRVVWVFAIPDILVKLMVGPAGWFTNVILMSIPNGVMQMGALNVAYTWRNLLLYIPAAMVRIALPMLSEIHGSRSAKDFERAVVIQIFLIWLLTLGPCVGIAAASPILLLIFGPEYKDANLVMTVTVLGATVQPMAALLSAALASKTKMWFLWVTTAISCVAWDLTAYFLTPSDTIFGGAVGSATSFIVFYVTQIVGMLLVIQSRSAWRAFLMPSLLAVAMAGVACFAAQLHVWLGLLLAVPLALAASWGCWRLAPPWARSMLLGATLRRFPAAGTWLNRLGLSA